MKPLASPARCPVPVNVDAENGYGDTPDAVADCIRRCIDAGAVGAGIEDYTWDPARPLYDRALAVERIRAAREAADASGVPFVLTARGRVLSLRRAGRLCGIRRSLEPSIAKQAPTACTLPG